MNTELYTEKGDVENYLMKSIDDGFDAQLDSWIMAMSRYIDRICSRVIFSENEVTMKYDGDGSNSLLIDSMGGISAVTLNDVEITPLEYPANSYGKTELRLENGVFSKGMQNVHVTGALTVSETLPDDIKLACTILVAGIVNNQIFNEKAGTTEKIGNYSVSYTTDAQRSDFATAKNIINSYRRITV